jgi:2,4-dienoyl-CoA reductase-like NADH-dependent reductase (Old Yellow Enzyme family)
MHKLFETSFINKMELFNRFVRAATYEGLASNDSSCTGGLIEKISELAEGGVGLIITSHAFVSADGRARPRQLGIYSDKMIPGLKQMAEAVHKTKAKIIIQLAHAGTQADSQVPNDRILGPSVFERNDKIVAGEMNAADILRVAESFGDAAKRAFLAGFDGIEIHAAHGYLLSQFLSRYFNKRNDIYGGSLENRARFLLLVVDKIRNRVGNDFAVLVKLNSEDFLENGFRLDDMIKLSKMLEEIGVNAIEMSGGTPLSGKKIPSRIGTMKTDKEEVYYREAALKFKKSVKIPLVLVGGIRSFNVAENLVNKCLADYIALSRPLIREPNLVNRWQSGDLSRATCISCNLCYQPILTGVGFFCEVENRLKIW